METFAVLLKVAKNAKFSSANLSPFVLDVSVSYIAVIIKFHSDRSRMIHVLAAHMHLSGYIHFFEDKIY